MHTGDLEAQIPQLRRYARALTGDRWAADDLVQDTLERACGRWNLWRAGTDLRAWLFTVMHNLFIDGARRTARQGGPHADLDQVEPEPAGVEGSPERLLDLQRCLSRLPEEQREVLLLVTLQDLSYQDVARITGAPVGTVMSRLSRARGRMRELMEGTTPRTAGSVVPLKRAKGNVDR